MIRNKLEKYLKNLQIWLLVFIPAEDKLKHFFFGTLGFCFFDLFFSKFYSLLLIFAFAFAWEIIQKISGGSNTKKGMVLDILFGILTGVLAYISSLI